MSNNSQKGFVMPVIIAIVAVVLVLGGVVYYANQSKEAEKMAEEKAMMEKKAMEENEKDAMMEKKDGEMMKDDSMMKKDEEATMDKGNTTMKYSGAMLAGKSAPLIDFTKADYDAAIKTDGTKISILGFDKSKLGSALPE